MSGLSGAPRKPCSPQNTQPAVCVFVRLRCGCYEMENVLSGTSRPVTILYIEESLTDTTLHYLSPSCILLSDHSAHEQVNSRVDTGALSDVSPRLSISPIQPIVIPKQTSITDSYISYSLPCESKTVPFNMN